MPVLGATRLSGRPRALVSGGPLPGNDWHRVAAAAFLIVPRPLPLPIAPSTRPCHPFTRLARPQAPLSSINMEILCFFSYLQFQCVHFWSMHQKHPVGRPGPPGQHSGLWANPCDSASGFRVFFQHLLGSSCFFFGYAMRHVGS